MGWGGQGLGSGGNGFDYRRFLAEQERQEEERRQQRGGFLVPKRFLGEDVDPDVGREARNRALAAFGSQLLGGPAVEGDYGGAFGNATRSFMETRDATLGAEMERRRQREKDALEARESEERIAGARTSRELAQEDQGFQREDRGREDAERGSTEARVRAVAQQILELDPASEEAKKAQAYAEGPNAYLFEDEVAALHERALARKRVPQDFRQETDLSLERARAQAGVGFGPVAEGRRSDEQLGLDKRRTAAYERQVAESGGFGGGRSRPGQRIDDVNALADDRYRALVAAAEDRVEAFKNDMRNVGKPVPVIQHERLMAQARDWATQEYARMVGDEGASSDETMVAEMVAEIGEARARGVLASRGYTAAEIDRLLAASRGHRP